MDIYTVLASKPHNPHYLIKYITFIKKCQLKNEGFNGYTEKHHICPKAKDMFPEYSSFYKNPWNLTILTARQHFIAHLILWKVFNTKSMAASVIFMRQKHNTSKLYEKIKSLHSTEVSKRMKNKLTVVDKNNNTYHVDTNDPRYLSGKLNHISKGKVVVKDKEGNVFKLDKDNPRFLSGELVGVMKNNGGYKWTEDQKDKIRGENNVGFRGKNHSKKTKAKMSESLRGGKTTENWKTVNCPHCNKSGKGPNMSRYHFNNCKFIS